MIYFQFCLFFQSFPYSVIFNLHLKRFLLRRLEFLAICIIDGDIISRDDIHTIHGNIHWTGTCRCFFRHFTRQGNDDIFFLRVHRSFYRLFCQAGFFLHCLNIFFIHSRYFYFRSLLCLFHFCICCRSLCRGCRCCCICRLLLIICRGRAFCCLLLFICRGRVVCWLLSRSLCWLLLIIFHNRSFCRGFCRLLSRSLRCFRFLFFRLSFFRNCLCRSCLFFDCSCLLH